MGASPKLGVNSLGVAITRTRVFMGLYSGSPILGSYTISACLEVDNPFLPP